MATGEASQKASAGSFQRSIGRLAKSEGPGSFTFLDTLAAAHAEAGQFDEAVRWQQQAVQLAPAPQQAELQERLELYRQGKPFRQSSKQQVEAP